jgi:hypothetical protein
MFTFWNHKNIRLMLQHQVYLFPKGHVAVPGNDFHDVTVKLLQLGRITNLGGRYSQPHGTIAMLAAVFHHCASPPFREYRCHPISRWVRCPEPPCMPQSEDIFLLGRNDSPETVCISFLLTVGFRSYRLHS